MMHLLQGFKTLNPEAILEEQEDKELINNLWGDEHIMIDLSKMTKNNIELLNSSRFPPQIAAIYHINQKSVEIIYTAFDVGDTLKQRSFEFHFGQNILQCRFDSPSELLLNLGAALFSIAEIGETDYRNLYSFNMYSRYKDRNPSTPRKVEFAPISFWIDGFSDDEEELIHLCKHLNFYMEFFDTGSPHIKIYEKLGPTEAGSQLTFPFDEFPEKINGRNIDEFVLDTMMNARSGAPSQRFMRYYQVLEYITFHFIKSDVQKRLMRVISAPDALNNPNKLLNLVVEILSEDKMSDEQKMVLMFKELLNPSIIWKYIDNNKGIFCEEVNFEGGFSMKAMCRETWTEEDFLASWIPMVPDALRQMRNALVHGREARMSKVISSSRANEQKVRRYARLIQLIALQAVAYSD